MPADAGFMGNAHVGQPGRDKGGCGGFIARQFGVLVQVVDPAAVSLGVKFTSDVSGFITGVRFYKGTGTSLVAPGAPLPSPDFALDAVAWIFGHDAQQLEDVGFMTCILLAANNLRMTRVLWKSRLPPRWSRQVRDPARPGRAAGLVAGCFEPLYGERSFAGYRAIWWDCRRRPQKRPRLKMTKSRERMNDWFSGCSLARTLASGWPLGTSTQRFHV